VKRIKEEVVSRPEYLSPSHLQGNRRTGVVNNTPLQPLT
jgi:hypothetical protein